MISLKLKGEGNGQSEHVWGVDLCCRFTMTSLALHSRHCVSACSPLFSRTPPHPTHYDVYNIKCEIYTIYIEGTKSPPGYICIYIKMSNLKYIQNIQYRKYAVCFCLESIILRYTSAYHTYATYTIYISILNLKYIQYIQYE